MRGRALLSVSLPLVGYQQGIRLTVSPPLNMRLSALIQSNAGMQGCSAADGRRAVIKLPIYSPASICQSSNAYFPFVRLAWTDTIVVLQVALPQNPGEQCQVGGVPTPTGFTQAGLSPSYPPGIHHSNRLDRSNEVHAKSSAILQDACVHYSRAFFSVGRRNC